MTGCLDLHNLPEEGERLDTRRAGMVRTGRFGHLKAARTGFAGVVAQVTELRRIGSNHARLASTDFGRHAHFGGLLDSGVRV